MDNFIGYLTLKTRIDTTDLRPQIEKTKNDIKKLKEQLDVDYGEDIINAKKEYNKIIESLEEVRKANPYPEQKRDIKELSKAAADALKNVRSLLAKQREAVASRTDINAKLSQAENRLAKLNAQQEKVEKSGIMNLKKSFEDGEKSLSKLLRRMAKYVLAVFGIRSAFMAVRNAINVISQNDAQLKADIDYMKNALAYTLEPIIRKIVEWAKLLMFYVGYIVKAWTGKNIWENANKSLKGANKEAKKLQKTLASFDEINVLNEQQDAGGGTTTPSFDLTAGMDNMKKPDWLEWIVQNKDDILFVMEGIGLSLLAWKLGLDALTSLGFGLILVGIVESVKSLLDYINDPSWENFGNLIFWIGVTIAGIGAVIFGWPGLLAGVAIALLGIVIKYWDKIKKFILDGVDNIKEWLTENFGVIGEMVGELLDGIVTGVVTFFDEIFKGVKEIIDGIILLFKGDLKGGLEKVFNGFDKILTAPFTAMEKVVIGILNALISALNFLIRGLNKLKFDVPDWVPGIGGKKWGFNIPEIQKIQLASGGIVDVPRTGVPLSSVYAGEKGAEGVLPLTDEATMTRLGQEIAKWIPINLNITNELDGRILSKRLEQVKQNNSFSRNGG